MSNFRELYITQNYDEHKTNHNWNLKCKQSTIKYVRLYMIVLFQISLADLKVVRVFEWYKAIDVKVDLSEYPKLKSLTDRVMNEPRIAAWVAKRP